jgi:type II secretory pathway pseudopilin PulG
MHHRRRNPSHRREQGYVLVGVLVMVTVMVIALAAIAPAIRTQIKRDREEELIRRGKQYARAIQLYYRKFGRYPNSIEQLENTNNVRFLRKKYTDPMTGKEEWKLIRFGQQTARRRPAYLGAASGAGGLGSPAAGGLGSTGTSQTPRGVTNASDISRPLSGSPTLGGGPIVGVASTSEKESLKELDGKTHYNEWEFLYDPSLDPNARQQPGGGTGTGDRTPRGQRPGPNPTGPGTSPPPPPQAPQ